MSLHCGLSIIEILAKHNDFNICYTCIYLKQILIILNQKYPLMAQSANNLNFKVVNMKFSVVYSGIKHRKRGQSMNIVQPVNQCNQIPKDRCMTANKSLFIPKNNIKSQVQFDNNRKINLRPLYPAQIVYSKFPTRKPRSMKSKMHFPVFREKIFSFNQSSASWNQPSIAEEFVKQKNIVNTDAMAKSCISISRNSAEKQSFMRYSQTTYKRIFDESRKTKEILSIK